MRALESTTILSKMVSTSLNFHLRGFPFIKEYPLPNQSAQSFTYEERVGVTCKGRVGVGVGKLVYKAELDQSHRSVIVKFVSRYNAAAQRLLAEQGLAPHIHYASIEDSTAPMYGGYHMVVMDFWDGNNPSELSGELMGRVSEAIQLLHSNNFVFRDLRLPNILVKVKKQCLLISIGAIK